MSAGSRPTVSIIMPVYNGEAFVREAIESALRQTYPNVELVVIDDGSTDNTGEILEDYIGQRGTKVITHEGNARLGVSFSRKAGIDNALGQYIAFLDADDIYRPDKIEVQVKAMESTADAVLCHTGAKIEFLGDERPRKGSRFEIAKTRQLYNLSDEAHYLRLNLICNPTVMVRATTLREVDFHSKQLFQFEDWLLWILLSERGPFLFLPDKLTTYRQHPESATSRVATDRLAWHYSKLELLLCAHSRLCSDALRAEVLLELRATIVWLFTEYLAVESPEAYEVSATVAEFAHNLFGNQNETIDEAIGRAWDVKHLARHLTFGQMAKAAAYRGALRFPRPRRVKEA